MKRQYEVNGTSQRETVREERESVREEEGESESVC